MLHRFWSASGPRHEGNCFAVMPLQRCIFLNRGYNRLFAEGARFFKNEQQPGTEALEQQLLRGVVVN